MSQNKDFCLKEIINQNGEKEPFDFKIINEALDSIEIEGEERIIIFEGIRMKIVGLGLDVISEEFLKELISEEINDLLEKKEDSKNKESIFSLEDLYPKEIINQNGEKEQFDIKIINDALDSAKIEGEERTRILEGIIRKIVGLGLDEISEEYLKDLILEEIRIVLVGIKRINRRK